VGIERGTFCDDISVAVAFVLPLVVSFPDIEVIPGISLIPDDTSVDLTDMISPPILK
jgi:hypothetical protein